MKKIIGVVVVLAALVAVSYFGMGILTEHTIREDASVVNQTNNGLMVNVADYKRGWFKSETQLNWNLHVPERTITDSNGTASTLPAQDLHWQMPMVIYHGPVIFHHGVHFGLGYGRSVINLPADLQAKFRETFTADSVEPKLDLSWFINYLNHTRFKLGVPQFHVSVQQQDGLVRMDWLGLNSATTISSNMDKVNGDFTINGIKVTKGETIATIGNVSSEYNLHKTDFNFYTGDASFALPSIVVAVNGDNVFALDDFTINSSSDVDNDLFSSHLKVSLNKITANKLTYGPGNLEMAVRNLDASVLSRINTQIQKSQQSPNEQEKQQALLAALPELPKLFSRGAEFEISEMSVTMPQGTIEGNVLINLPKGDFSNPFEIMQKIHGSGKLKLPAEVLKDILNQSNKQKVLSQAVQQELVKQMQEAQAQGSTNTSATALPDVAQQVMTMTNQQIAAYLQNGLIVQQGNDYVLEVNLTNGHFVVNGKPFSPAMLQVQ